MDKHKLLFDTYMDLQSKEQKLNITRYKEFKEPGGLIAIKVNFKNGDWLIVYYNKRNEVLWY
jgi:hypothetical protein